MDLGIGPWPSFPGRDADAGVVGMKVSGWVLPKQSLRQDLGAWSPSGRHREWGSDRKIRKLPHSPSKGATEGLWDQALEGPEAGTLHPPP